MKIHGPAKIIPCRPDTFYFVRQGITSYSGEKDDKDLIIH
jgi:hypothetical protein